MFVLRLISKIEDKFKLVSKRVDKRGGYWSRHQRGFVFKRVLSQEELNEILPEVVLKNEEGDPDSVSYGRITAVLIEAIKDLKKEIEELKSNK